MSTQADLAPLRDHFSSVAAARRLMVNSIYQLLTRPVASAGRPMSRGAAAQIIVILCRPYQIFVPAAHRPVVPPHQILLLLPPARRTVVHLQEAWATTANPAPLDLYSCRVALPAMPVFGSINLPLVAAVYSRLTIWQAAPGMVGWMFI